MKRETGYTCPTCDHHEDEVVAMTVHQNNHKNFTARPTPRWEVVRNGKVVATGDELISLVRDHPAAEFRMSYDRQYARTAPRT